MDVLANLMVLEKDENHKTEVPKKINKFDSAKSVNCTLYFRDENDA